MPLSTSSPSMLNSKKRSSPAAMSMEKPEIKKSKSMTYKIDELTDNDLAVLAISLIDNTSLDLDKETEESIKALCQSSVMEEPFTAAVCVYPKWIKLCKKQLVDSGVLVATVVNFPLGQDDEDDIVSVTAQAIEDGVDEVDLVIDYNEIKEDKSVGCKKAEDITRLIKEICGDDVILKVIIEAGELETKDLVQAATRAAIRGGCNFVKTSTGKVSVNATEENARWMMEAVAEAKAAEEGLELVGFKAAGGVKSLESTRAFLKIAEDIHGFDFINDSAFRFGASSLLKILRASVEEGASVSPPPVDGENGGDEGGY
eukprot:GHVH01001645.1.p1 GENE.GHVH01001645.1~~GHVH01001645.1.p1  ORF type:complete len:315 (+),score=81.91 GHVH01001645.1:157-1101(+)